MKIEVEKLACILQSQSKENKIILIENVSIDSRSLKNATHTLFFALKGNLTNGHYFIDDLYKQGVRYFVISENITENKYPDALFFRVKNTQVAFQKFAQFYREQYHFPIIGITGSNGKTIVKEWLSDLLSVRYQVVKNPKSYNSQIGVPLSIFGINEQHNLGLFEAGISEVNEMCYLEQIIQPNIGIVTNIGSAHDEGFKNREEKIREKLKLFTNAEVLIIPNDEQLKQFVEKDKALVWGFDSSCDIFFKPISKHIFEANFKGEQYVFKLNYIDAPSIHNALVCVATLLYLGYTSQEISEQIQHLQKINMRLEVKKGRNGCILIDDSYSSDYQSLTLALDFLCQQQKHTKKTLILSDILQSGLPDEQLYKKVIDVLKKYEITKIIGIGKQISTYLPNEISSSFFETTEDFLAQFNFDSFQNETILIKGSRIFSFEKIVEELENKTHQTILEINLDAITHNYTFFKSKLKPETKIMVMLKANGYGNGTYEIAKHLEHLNAAVLGVAFADEGVFLRRAGIKMPIMVMNPEYSSFSQMIHYQLEPEIYSISELQAFIKQLKKWDKSQYPIHIKLNTGMNRLGFKNTDLQELLAIVKSEKSVTIKSVFSHLATADDSMQKAYTKEQFKVFEEMCTTLEKELESPFIKHILNSEGILNFPEYQYDSVRLGIGLYGISADAAIQKKLRCIATLKTKILQTYAIEAGEAVGYGRNFIAKNPTNIAILPIGYADGIRRIYGNGNGKVFIHNKFYPIIGNICMDMLMIDLGTDEIQDGTEVEIFGEHISVSEIAACWQTIPYEVMTAISQRVKRVFYKE